MNKIVLHRNYFSSEDQIWDELELNGLHAMEMDVPAVANESHWHEFSTWMYILSGELNITDSKLEKTLKAGPGCRVDVPERVLHCENSSGYKIIAGLTSLPKDPNDVDLPPETLSNT
jgi:uncharacterized RmlC-like cupin family protein